MRALLLVLLAAASVSADTFILPTPNRALVNDGALSEKYLVGTTGKPWQSGGFGCVRSEGYKMHEGLDIRCTKRDKRQEPIDPIFASAAGTVAYVNNKPGLSNYGRYIVLRHNIEGLEICTLYAHLSEVAEGVAVGQSVKQGQVIATMGRTSNTREGISKERAHLHFEFDFIVNEKYSAWHERFMSAQRNDHGNWNGHNLVAIEATPILLAAAREGTNFSLLKVVQSRKEVCRVFVKDANFPLLKRYPALVKQSAAAAKEGVAGYEVALDFNGAPVELIARAPSETRNAGKVQLIKVNEAELSQHHCCKLIVTRKGKRELSNAALQELSLLAF